MGIIWTGKYTQIYGEHDPENNIIAPFTDFHWSILVCQLCNSPIVRQTAAFSELDIENYVTETLYPSNRKFRYLPTKVQRSYDAAMKIMPIDPNSFAVLIGRTLEFMCQDRQAKGKILSTMLNDLATRGEIPKLVVDIANSLRLFRNIGAHASDIDISRNDAEIMKDLCGTILEYVYEAPSVLQNLQKRSARIRGPNLKSD